MSIPGASRLFRMTSVTCRITHASTTSAILALKTLRRLSSPGNQTGGVLAPVVGSRRTRYTGVYRNDRPGSRLS